MAMQSGGLPSEYRKVEYLESTGTQYIDTGAYFVKNDICTIDFAPLESAVDKAVFGVYGSSTNIAELGFLSDRFRFDVTTTLGDIYEVGTRYKVVKDGATWSVDDWTSALQFINNDVPQHSLLLFGRWYNEEATKLSANRIFGYEHERSGNKIRNFIPCIRKADGKPGMYDIVTKTFYTNAGTGEFIVPN